MDEQEYTYLDFSQPSRIPHRLIWTVGVVVTQIVLWLIIPDQLLRWLLIPLVGVLGWAASFGWRQALKAIRFWIDQMIEEDF